MGRSKEKNPLSCFELWAWLQAKVFKKTLMIIFVAFLNNFLVCLCPSADICKRCPHPGADVHYSKVGGQAQVWL